MSGLHKFITKRKLDQSTITWRPKEVTQTPIRQQNGLRYEIFAQGTITIEPRTSVTLQLGFGVQMTRGICMVSLRQKIKEKRCSLQDGTISEDVDDIIVTIQNNSDVTVTISEGESLCYVNYYVVQFYVK